MQWLNDLINSLGGQKEAAVRIGVSRSTIRRWVKGTQQPSEQSLAKIDRVRVETLDDWDPEESALFERLMGDDSNDANGDTYLQELFDAAMFHPEAGPSERQAAYDELIEYLRDEYDIDFEDIFDWEDYREWYDNAA